MSDENAPNPLLVVGGLISLYLAPIGPIARLMDEGYIAERNPVLDALYLPVNWAMQHSDLVCDLVFAYLSVWGVRIG